MDTLLQTLYPAKIIKAEKAENENSLLIKKDLQISKFEKSYVTLHQGGYVILDFGKEIVASIRILTFEANAHTIRIRTGESLTEACSDLGGKQNATNAHALRDYETQLIHLADMTYIESGFRFVRIDLISTGSVKIKSIVAQSKLLNLPSIYEYNGSDKRLKEIFDVAKYTVDLCSANDLIWDGIKRDRLVWIGDMHPEMEALTSIYGRVQKIENSMRFVESFTPHDEWMNGIVTYSMWWVIILSDYYDATSCDDFAQEMISRVEIIGAQLLPLVHEDGSLHYKDRIIIDWPTSGQVDEMSGVRALNIIACNCAIKLLNKFSKDTSTWENLLTKLRKKEISPAINKSVLSLKYWANGKLSEEEVKLLIKGGAKGLSTFFSYYMLKAIADNTSKEYAKEICKEYYGGMLDRGATSFWEDFSIDWLENSGRIDEFPQEGMLDIHGDFGAHCYVGFRHSLCHGWSSGVAKFIKEYFFND